MAEQHLCGETTRSSNIATWYWPSGDGKSRGNQNVIDRCKERGVPIKVFLSNKAAPQE
jgi:hypothetical protein